MDLSRRDFAKTAVLGAAAVGAAGLIGACGGSSAPAPNPAAGNGKPKRGGTLRAAITGGSGSDTLDPLKAITNADFSRVNNLFEPLLGLNFAAQPELVLAEELTSNADATMWTVRLRKGITFHNGKPLTADDVIYTFQTILNPKNMASARALLSSIDAKGLKALDTYTVQIPCKTPFATLAQALAIPGYSSSIIPVGFNPRTPVGTGPFKLKSFTPTWQPGWQRPRAQSTFVRYDGYWQSGLPYLDEVVITDYTDETSQVNSLVAGQVDVVNLLSADVIYEVQGQGKRILISAGGGWNPFTMRVDSPPFNDARVRRAMRLLVDRQQILDLVFGGHGTIGNDVFGIWAPEYDHSLPQRQQDIGQAKSLLRAAGQDGLTVQLVTADIAQGTVRAAQVFAQQALAAGVKVNLRPVTVIDFYNPSSYLKWVFAQDYWYYNFYLPQVALATLPPPAPYNETHFRNPAYDALYRQAIAAVDASKRTELAREMQRIDYDDGGYIIPFFPPVIDGYGTNVHGLIPSKGGLSLNGYNFGRVWLS
jgi:peptide/nickel transport system substrate-binding protein